MIIFGCTEPFNSRVIEGEMNHNHKMPVSIQEITFRGQLL